MTDLSHWNFATTFTGQQAAALILGLDPSETENLQKIQPVLDRMKSCYAAAQRYHRLSTVPEGKPINPPHTMLESWSILVLECPFGDSYDDGENLREWLDSDDAVFSDQTFSREQLSRWLKAINAKSVYQFLSDTPLRAELETSTKSEDYEPSPAERRTNVREVLAKHNGNQTQAAKELGISRARVGQLIKNPGNSGRKPLAFSAQDPFGMAKKPTSNKHS